MRTITEKIATINGTGNYDIEEEILSLGAVLRQQNETAYAGVVTKLASEMSTEDREELWESLRNPHLSFGVFKDDPVWLEVEQAIERNRERDREESVE